MGKLNHFPSAWEIYHCHINPLFCYLIHIRIVSSDKLLLLARFVYLLINWNNNADQVKGPAVGRSVVSKLVPLFRSEELEDVGSDVGTGKFFWWDSTFKVVESRGLVSHWTSH